MAVAWLAAVPAARAAPAAEPPVSISSVSADFLPNPSNSGAFDASQLSNPVFTETFPVIDFNPPSSAQVACTNSTGVDENSRPFTDVAPLPDGSCETIVAGGSGQQAGVGSMSAFQAVVTAKVTLQAAGKVTFNFFSDDGWMLGVDHRVDGSDQPTYTSGAMVNPPSQGVSQATPYGTTPAHGYPVVGSYNTNSSPSQQQVTVTFPAAGTYPIELDYTECCGGQLALTLGTTYGNPIPPATGTGPTAKTGAVQALTPSSTTITGTVDPGHASTSYHFDWGTTAGYGSQTGAGSIAMDAGVQDVSAGLSGLQPATTYHYRVVGSNVFGTSIGDDASFTTPLPEGYDPFISPTPTDRTFFDTRFPGCCSFDVVTQDPTQTITYGPSNLPNLTCASIDNPGSKYGALHSQVHCDIHPGNDGESYIPQVEFDARNAQGNVTGTRTYRMGNGMYLALGDSFQSGEGAYDYEAPTNSDANQCHRSTHAYARAVERYLAPGITDFVACSGSRVADVMQHSPPRDRCQDDQYKDTYGKQPCLSGEDPQIQHINSYDSVITLGIGGNDLGFAPIVQTCIEGALKKQSGLGVILGAVGIDFGGGDCSAQDQSRDLDAKLAELQRRLTSVYDLIQQQAPLARILVVDYPREFPRAGNADNGLGQHLCLGLGRNDQLWLNELANRLDRVIEAATVESGTVELVQVRDAFEGHDQCSADPWANGLVGAGNPESVHPNAEGQRAFADAVIAQLRRRPRVQVFDVLPNEIDEATDTVPPDALDWSVRDDWPGSSVSMTLVSPSGRTYTDTTPGVTHVRGSTFEALTIHHPERGTWKVRLHGDDVSRYGETVRLRTTSLRALPSPRVTASRQATLVKRWLRIPLRCIRADYACSGSYRLFLPHARRPVVRSGFAVLARQRGLILARLNRHALRILARRRVERLRLTLVVDGAAGGVASRRSMMITLVVPSAAPRPRAPRFTG